jgi:hypothetical protein
LQRKLAGALLVALALGVVACGDASKPLTAAQLQQQANAICQDMTRHIQALAAHSTPATMRTGLGRSADVLTDGINRLHAIIPPKQLAAQYASFLVWEGVRRDGARAFSRGSTLSTRMRMALDDHHSPAVPLARELGLPSCA